MARNAIQMQKGLSLTELNEQFGTEEKCKAAVFKWRSGSRGLSARQTGRHEFNAGAMRYTFAPHSLTVLRLE